MKLWLDDVLPPLKGWVWCKSAEECTLMWAIFKNEVTEITKKYAYNNTNNY